MPGLQTTWQPEAIDLQHGMPNVLCASGCYDKARQEARNGDACRNRAEQRKPDEGCDIGEGKKCK